MAIYTIGASGSEPALAAVETAHLPTENRPALAVGWGVVLASTSSRSGSRAEAETNRLILFARTALAHWELLRFVKNLVNLGELQNPGSPISGHVGTRDLALCGETLRQ